MLRALKKALLDEQKLEEYDEQVHSFLFPDLYPSSSPPTSAEKQLISTIWPLFFYKQIPHASVTEIILREDSREKRIRGVLKLFYILQGKWKEAPDPETAPMYIGETFDEKGIHLLSKTGDAYFIHCTFKKEIEWDVKTPSQLIAFSLPKDSSFNYVIAPRKARLAFGPMDLAQTLIVTNNRFDGFNALYAKPLTIASHVEVKSGATYHVATQILLVVNHSNIETLKWNDNIVEPLLYLEDESCIKNILPKNVQIYHIKRGFVTVDSG